MKYLRRDREIRRYKVWNRDMRNETGVELAEKVQEDKKLVWLYIWYDWGTRDKWRKKFSWRKARGEKLNMETDRMCNCMTETILRKGGGKLGFSNRIVYRFEKVDGFL